jgi:hypothetical protein
MTNQPQPPAPESRSEDEIDEILGRANPNPGRVGCPPKDVLIAVARRELPIDHPVHEHLIKCSPCYQEFRALQLTAPAQPPVADDTRRWWLAAAAAAALVVIAGGWFFFAADQALIPPGETGAEVQTAALRTELDLRKYTVARSERTRDERPPLSLPRGQLTLTILLPVGSEPGGYEVQVLDSELRSRAAATGEAEIRDFVTILQASMDLSSLTPGAHQLAVRRHGDEWQLFPATVR